MLSGATNLAAVSTIQLSGNADRVVTLLWPGCSLVACATERKDHKMGFALAMLLLLAKRVEMKCTQRRGQISGGTRPNL